MENIKIKRALISVSDKSGLEGLAKVLAKNEIEIIANYLFELPNFVDVLAYEKAGFEIINNFRIFFK